MPRTAPVLCDECGVMLSSLDAMRKHKRRVHPILVRMVSEVTSSANPSASLGSPLGVTCGDDKDSVSFSSYLDFLNEPDDATPVPVTVPILSGDVVTADVSVFKGTRNLDEELQADWTSLPALDLEVSASAFPLQYQEAQDCPSEAVVGVECMADEWATQWPWDRFLLETQKLWPTCPESLIRNSYLARQSSSELLPPVDWSPMPFEEVDCGFDGLLHEWQSY